jgi:hypothetical protein
MHGQLQKRFAHHQKQNALKKRLTLAIFAVAAIVMPLRAQWECPSQLGGSLKQVGDSKLMWASELELAAGVLDQQPIFNTMGLVGLDFTTGHHTIYTEGGLKYWSRRDNELDATFSNAHLGIREAYYQFKNNTHNLTLGINTMKSDDGYLLNERVLGLNYQLKLDTWELQAMGGSVTKDFARNGTFCNVAYIYDILPYRQVNTLGNLLGETNLAMVNLMYHPGKKPDEFAAADDGLSAETDTGNSDVHVETIGMSLYSQFGSLLPVSSFLAGGYAVVDFGKDWLFKPDVFYQMQTDNQAVIVNAQLEKSLTWTNNQRSSAEVRYVGLIGIDDNATAQNLFSNIFAGTVLRLDAPDVPFWQIGIKHSLPRGKFHVKLQYTGQTENDHLSEMDIEVGRKFWDALRLNATYGVVSGNSISHSELLRIEARLTF